MALSRIQTLKYSTIALQTAGLRLLSRNAAKKFLMEKLMEDTGLPFKGAQLLGILSKDSLPGEQKTQNQKLSLYEIQNLIRERNADLEKEISELDPIGKSASLGQVHSATLKTGEKVVIKVQYPEVRNEIESQLELLLQAAARSPAKNFGFDVDNYRREFKVLFLAETDYVHEALNQKRATLEWGRVGAVAIPKVFTQYSTHELLVQSYEQSEPLSQLSDWPERERKQAAENWISYFLDSLLKKNWIHGDLHGANYGFRKEQSQLVIYDFGAMLENGELQRSAFQKLLRATAQNSSAEELFSILVSIGFESEKLLRILEALPIMARNMLSPFLGLEKSHEDLSAEKWWLRCAGPPSFLLLMRTVTGFLEGVKKLQAEKMLVERVGDILKVDRPLKEMGNHTQPSPIGAHLCVQVKRQGEVKTSIKLPVRAVEDLESLLEEEITRKIQSLGVNLKEVTQAAVKSGYKPQVLFEATVGEKELRVWIS